MSQQSHSNNPALQKLKDTDLTLAEPGQDIRGRNVVDRNGTDIGHISALFIDENERKVRMLEICAGGFLGLGDRHFLLPIEAVASIAEDQVHISETQDRLVHSPVYNPELVTIPTHQSWEPYYGYYGIFPYWGSDPTFPMFQEKILPYRRNSE